MMRPKADSHGVGWCPEDDTCPEYDGKCCKITGFQPRGICEPWARVRVDDLVALSKQVREKAQAQAVAAYTRPLPYQYEWYRRMADYGRDMMIARRSEQERDRQTAWVVALKTGPHGQSTDDAIRHADVCLVAFERRFS